MKSKLIYALIAIMIIAAAYNFYCVASMTEQIDLNTASYEELKELPLIGEVRAEYIIEYRQDNWIEEVEQLEEIKGIGEGVVNEISDYVE